MDNEGGWSDRTKWAMSIASALIVAAVVALAGRLFHQPTGIPPQDVSFVASTPPEFAIQSEFRGTAKVADDGLLVEVKRARISYRRSDGGYDGPRTITDLRASLVEPYEGSWRPIRQSARYPIGREVRPGDEIELDGFSVTISLQGLDSISHHSLLFDVNETIQEESGAGSSHAHALPGLFSD